MAVKKRRKKVQKSVVGTARALVTKWEGRRPTPEKQAAREALQAEANDFSRMKRRRSGEVAQYVLLGNLRVDPVVAEILTIASLQRGVTIQALRNDIIVGWIRGAVDLRQAIYREVLPHTAKPPPLIERRPGYLASLGFAQYADDEQVPPDEERVVLPDTAIAEAATIVDARPLPPDVPAEMPGEARPAFVAVSSPIDTLMFARPDIVPIPDEEREMLATYGGSGVKRFDQAEYDAQRRGSGVGNAAQGYWSRPQAQPPLEDKTP